MLLAGGLVLFGLFLLFLTISGISFVLISVNVVNKPPTGPITTILKMIASAVLSSVFAFVVCIVYFFFMCVFH